MVSSMTVATLLIKKMPADLKDWLAGEAQRNHRSTNKQIIFLLEKARSLGSTATKPARDAQAIAGVLQAMQALPVLDSRPMNDVLYDTSGLPQ